ncbi:MAG: hypothetical protein H0V63_10305 [Burkholderiaceae bacterium]|nr:hypothetical protein [Burkholderiaceae bacterium]
MILDERAIWTREDVAEYLSVTTRQVDLLRSKLPAPLMVGSRPRWKAGSVMAAVANNELKGN